MKFYKVEIEDHKARVWTVYVQAERLKLGAYLRDLRTLGNISHFTVTEPDNIQDSFSAFTQFLVSRGIA